MKKEENVNQHVPEREPVPGLDYHDDRLNGPIYATFTPYEDLSPEEKREADEIMAWYKQIMASKNESEDEE